jgi:cell wall-associated NlpC family hydrolase
MPARTESGDEELSRDSDQGSPRMDISHPTVAGRFAVLRNGIAYAPSRAPKNVKNAIWAANTLRRKPYVWGGGHGSFNDRGYDCSGTVSFALHYAGLLDAPLPSSDFCRYGARGRGRWITIYSRNGHTFAVIAGLRLDTTDLRYGDDIGPRWYADGRDTGGFEARHPIGL